MATVPPIQAFICVSYRTCLCHSNGHYMDFWSFFSRNPSFCLSCLLFSHCRPTPLSGCLVNHDSIVEAQIFALFCQSPIDLTLPSSVFSYVISIIEFVTPGLTLWVWHMWAFLDFDHLRSFHKVNINESKNEQSKKIKKCLFKLRADITNISLGVP